MDGDVVGDRELVPLGACSGSWIIANFGMYQRMGVTDFGGGVQITFLNFLLIREGARFGSYSENGI